MAANGGVPVRRSWLADLTFLAGAGLAVYGLWHFSPSVALILGGLGLAAGAVFLVPASKDGDAE